MTQLLWYPNFVISVICLTPYLKKYISTTLNLKKKKKQMTTWKNYWRNLLQRLIFLMYKEFFQINKEKANSRTEKWAKGTIQTIYGCNH